MIPGSDPAETTVYTETLIRRDGNCNLDKFWDLFWRWISAVPGNFIFYGSVLGALGWDLIWISIA